MGHNADVLLQREEGRAAAAVAKPLGLTGHQPQQDPQ